MDNFDFTKYLDMAVRRKWWIIIPFLVVLLGGLTFCLVCPKTYEAKTLILVQPQKVPQEYVRNIISTTVEDRLRTISQQVTSRTNLEKIIRKYEMHRFPQNDMPMDIKVELMRKRIKIDVSHRGRGNETNSFTISFSGKEPERVSKVTNALAGNFITENLRIRESQAMGTSTFISDELDSVKKRLMDKEEELKQYREKYMGGLPEQLDTNLAILERLQAQLDQLNSNLRDAENRKILIQAQITDQQRSIITSSPGAATQMEEMPRNINSLRNELASLELRYTQNHPDVIRLKKMIAVLGAQISGSETGSDEVTAPVSRVVQELKRQFQDVIFEIKILKEESSDTKSKLKWHQKMIEETPKREQEQLAMNRDYENLNEVYNSLLSRKLEAEIAVSMEKKQKGEQFKVVDPAITPSHPVKPDLKKILMLTLVLGLGLGGGLAFLKETLDTSYKTPDEIETETGLPVLVSMPIMYTEKELKKMKTKEVIAYASVAAGFVVSVIVIIISTKGADATFEFINKIMGRV